MNKVHVRIFMKKLSLLAGAVLVTCFMTNVAQAAACYLYGVNMQGNATIGDANFVAANQQFSINQYAVLRDQGAFSHPIEIAFLTFQDLNAAAQVGQIELMTNSFFARNVGIASARFDLAAVVSSNVWSFQLDPAMSFQMPAPNVFIAPGQGTIVGGLGGLGFAPGLGTLSSLIGSSPVLAINYLVPRSGGGYVYSPDGAWSTIAGEINIVGTSQDNTNYQGNYAAVVNGSFLGSFDCS
jgi:hypothetical protein